MKPLSLFYIFCFLSMVARPQSNSDANNHSSLNPTYLNQVYLVQGDSLLALEHIDAHMKTKLKAFGWGGSEGGFYMNGEKSPVRIKAGDSFRFAVKLGSAMMGGDPSMTFRFYRFTVQKGSRGAIVDSENPWYTGKGSKDKATVNYNVQKGGNDVYLLTPATGLPPGEYGFLNIMTATGPGGTYQVFAFGVDQ